MTETYTAAVCKILNTTHLALRVELEDETSFWVPKSICSEGAHKLDELVEGDEVELRIADWFLNKQGDDHE